MHDSDSGIRIDSGMIPFYAGIGIGIKNIKIEWNRNQQKTGWNRSWNQTFELTWSRNRNHTWVGIVHHCYKQAWSLEARELQTFCKFILSDRRDIHINHPWLSRIPAPVGSQEVVEHTHKLALLIGQFFPQCRLGRPSVIISDLTCTTVYSPTCLRCESP